MEHSLFVWWAAIDSGFALEPQWVAWADQQILRLDAPPLWILDLSLVHTVREAQEVFGRSWARMSVSLEKQGWFDDLWMGFIYLRFERHRIDLLNLLLAAGGRADCSSFRINCEAFYMMANEIDGGGPTIASDRPLGDRTVELFAPMANLARREWTTVWAGSESPP